MKSIATFLLASSLMASAIAADDSILDSAIPGEMQVRLASARPAPRSMQLLFACGIDRYLEDHKAEFDKLAFARRQCKDTEETAIYIFRHYKIQYERFSPDGEPASYASQRKTLEAFLSSGYDGIYLRELKGFIGTLKFMEIASAPSTSHAR